MQPNSVSTDEMEPDSAAGEKISSRTRSKIRSKMLKIRSKKLKYWWNTLPVELSDDIFLRVPGKSILSLRCVCKLFRNLLSEPSFIKNHVNRTMQSKVSKLVFSKYTPDYTPMIYSMPIDYPSISTPSPSSATLLCECNIMTNYPVESGRLYFPDFVGSCNGLVCLRVRSIVKRGGLNCTMEAKFCVLNPLTREFKGFEKPENCDDNVTFGFGYDSSINDYKLVIISLRGCLKIDIYTLRSADSSSSIQCTDKFSSLGDNASGCVFFNGCLHWLVTIDTHGISSEVIFSVDIINETVVNMPLPEFIMPPKDYTGEVYKNVGVWGDCIGITLFWDSVRIDVWVMREYGVKESWIRKYTTTPLPQWYRRPMRKPLFYFDHGKILVDYGFEELLLFDPTLETVRTVVVGDMKMGDNRESYVETIATLGSGTYLDGRITDMTCEEFQAMTTKNPKQRRLR